MGYQPANIELPGENQADDFALKREIRGVAPDKILFVDANGAEIQFRHDTSSRVCEEQNLPTASHEIEGLARRFIRWHC